jgi:hypothetical protein
MQRRSADGARTFVSVQLRLERRPHGGRFGLRGGDAGQIEDQILQRCVLFRMSQCVFKRGQACIKRCAQGVQLALGRVRQIASERIKRSVSRRLGAAWIAHRKGTRSDYSFCLWQRVTECRTSQPA